jgi:hypothetical protein
MSANLLFPFEQLFFREINQVYVFLTIANGVLAILSMAIAGYWLAVNQQKEVTYKDLLITAVSFSVVMVAPSLISYVLESSPANYYSRFSLLLSNIYTAIILFIFGFVGISVVTFLRQQQK